MKVKVEVKINNTFGDNKTLSLLTPYFLPNRIIRQQF